VLALSVFAWHSNILHAVADRAANSETKRLKARSERPTQLNGLTTALQNEPVWFKKRVQCINNFEKQIQCEKAKQKQNIINLLA